VGGVPHRTVRDLFLVSNLFVFPSLSEASSLVLGEASLAGCLIVTNSALRETENLITDGGLIRRDFGTPQRPLGAAKPEDVGGDIFSILSQSLSNLSKRKMLREFNFTTIGETLRSLVEGLPLH